MFFENREPIPGDRSHVNVENREDLLYWTETLDVDEPTLRGALQAVGDRPGDVRDYLKLRKEAQAA